MPDDLLLSPSETASPQVAGDASPLHIRPAQATDRAAMERICAHTWDWGDYIPETWDEWLADKGGGLTVGEMDGRVIAVSKATYQPGGQAWLEGMRVDPDYRGRGVASRYLDYNIKEAWRRGARVARLGTGGNNTPVHRMVTRAGMERVGVYAVWTAEPLPDGPQPAILTTRHTPSVQTFLENSPVLAHTHGLYSFDWVWQELSVERVAQFLIAGQVAGWFAADGDLAALAPICFAADDDILWIGLVDGRPSAVTDLATALRGYAAQAGAQQVCVMLPDLPWLRDALQAAGYGYGDWEGELWIFEIRLNQSWAEGNHDR